MSLDAARGLIHWTLNHLGGTEHMPVDRVLAAMRDRGLDAGPLDDTTSDKGLIATTADPEGNAITLVEQR